MLQKHVRNEPSDVPNAEVHLRGSRGQLRSEDLLGISEAATGEGTLSCVSLNSSPFDYAHVPADADDNSFLESVHSL